MFLATQSNAAAVRPANVSGTPPAKHSAIRAQCKLNRGCSELPRHLVGFPQDLEGEDAPPQHTPRIARRRRPTARHPLHHLGNLPKDLEGQGAPLPQIPHTARRRRPAAAPTVGTSIASMQLVLLVLPAPQRPRAIQCGHSGPTGTRQRWRMRASSSGSRLTCTLALGRCGAGSTWGASSRSSSARAGRLS